MKMWHGPLKDRGGYVAITNADFALRVSYLLREVIDRHTCLVEGLAMSPAFGLTDATRVEDFCESIRDRIAQIEKVNKG
jgi:hypothetical protein